ncbi:MAG: SDR family NAD(P)-dependent oxidoreductase [Chloroflexota bacterium]
MTQQQPEYVPLDRLLSLEGKTAIITGGAKGIGHGIVKRFAEAGASVVIADYDEQAAKGAAEEVNSAGGKAVAARCDVASESDIKETVAMAARELGSVDILVNNAGIYPLKPALQMTADEWQRVQDVNLRGLFLFSREFANRNIEQGGGGVIVNIGSIDSLHPSSVGLAAYDASKGGVLMFTKNFALEVAPHGIRVNMIAPGGIATEGTSGGASGPPQEELAQLIKEFMAKIPLGRMGVPDDIATVALVLATPASAYMTGETVVVDGGRLLS